MGWVLGKVDISSASGVPGEQENRRKVADFLFEWWLWDDNIYKGVNDIGKDLRDRDNKKEHDETLNTN